MRITWTDGWALACAALIAVMALTGCSPGMRAALNNPTAVDALHAQQVEAARRSTWGLNQPYQTGNDTYWNKATDSGVTCRRVGDAVYCD